MESKMVRSKKDRVFEAVNLSLLFLLLALVAYPLLYVVSASLSDPSAVLAGKVILLPKGISLEAYKMVLRNDDIMMGYRNTIIYTVVGTMLNLLLTVITAYPLSRTDLWGRRVFNFLFTFTMFFSGGMIPSYLINKSLGLVNSFWAMILPGAISMYNVIIMRTFFQSSIPMEIQEAGMIDGCSNVGLLARIVFPLSKPVLAVMVLFYGVAHWNAYFNALIYLMDRSLYPLQVVLREILIQNEMNDMMNLASDSVAQQQMMSESIKYAVIIVASLPALVVYPFLQRFFIKGVMVGAVKG